MSADTRKFILMLAGIIGAVTLAALDKIGGSEAFGGIMVLTGYGIGNGYNSLKGRISTPVFIPKLPPPDPNTIEKEN